MARAALEEWRRRIREAVGAAAGDGGYPLEAVRRLLALGVQRIPFDPTVGGEGLGLRGFTAVLEDIAAVDGSLAAVVMGAYSAGAFLASAATPEQRRALLAPLLAGEGMYAVAVTEPEAGTDVAAIRTRCRRLPDGTWRLDGRKAFISNTGHELWRGAVVLARGPDPDRHTAFLVPADAPGFSLGPVRDTIGWSRVGVHDLVLDGVVVADERRLGEPGKGMGLALATFDRGRVAVASLACGLCRAAWEEADAYARRRHSFGDPLVAHEAVADHVLRLWRLYNRARLVTRQAAEAADAGLPLAVWAALAKWEATDAAVEAARLGGQVMGGRGLLRGTGAAARWGDAKVLEIVEGTTEALTLVLRRRLRWEGLAAAPEEEPRGAAHAGA